jgi:hypothetical protein
MSAQSDLFEGWFDNSRTQHREYWQDGKRGRHGHRNGIAPDSPFPEFRKAWGANPDLPANAAQVAA